jgi:hypothetical protein
LRVLADALDLSAADRATLMATLTAPLETPPQRVTDDAVGAAFVLRYLGTLASAKGDRASALGFLEQSLATARQVGASMDVAMALAYLGDMALRHGDVDRARELFEESR